jgi:hypothetical protein
VGTLALRPTQVSRGYAGRASFLRKAGFEMGADYASLQASPIGRPVYSTMGFKTTSDYRLLMCPKP